MRIRYQSVLSPSYSRASCKEVYESASQFLTLVQNEIRERKSNPAAEAVASGGSKLASLHPEECKHLSTTPELIRALFQVSRVQIKVRQASRRSIKNNSQYRFKYDNLSKTNHEQFTRIDSYAIGELSLGLRHALYDYCSDILIDTKTNQMRPLDDEKTIFWITKLVFPPVALSMFFGALMNLARGHLHADDANFMRTLGASPIVVSSFFRASVDPLTISKFVYNASSLRCQVHDNFYENFFSRPVMFKFLSSEKCTSQDIAKVVSGLYFSKVKPANIISKVHNLLQDETVSASSQKGTTSGAGCVSLDESSRHEHMNKIFPAQEHFEIFLQLMLHEGVPRIYDAVNEHPLRPLKLLPMLLWICEKSLPLLPSLPDLDEGHTLVQPTHRQSDRYLVRRLHKENMQIKTSLLVSFSTNQFLWKSIHSKLSSQRYDHMPAFVFLPLLQGLAESMVDLTEHRYQHDMCMPIVARSFDSHIILSPPTGAPPRLPNQLKNNISRIIFELNELHQTISIPDLATLLHYSNKIQLLQPQTTISLVGKCISYEKFKTLEGKDESNHRQALVRFDSLYNPLLDVIGEVLVCFMAKNVNPIQISEYLNKCSAFKLLLGNNYLFRNLDIGKERSFLSLLWKMFVMLHWFPLPLQQIFVESFLSIDEEAWGTQFEWEDKRMNSDCSLSTCMKSLLPSLLSYSHHVQRKRHYLLANAVMDVSNSFWLAMDKAQVVDGLAQSCNCGEFPKIESSNVVDIILHLKEWPSLPSHHLGIDSLLNNGRMTPTPTLSYDTAHNTFQRTLMFDSSLRSVANMLQTKLHHIKLKCATLGACSPSKGTSSLNHLQLCAEFGLTVYNLSVVAATLAEEASSPELQSDSFCVQLLDSNAIAVEDDDFVRMIATLRHYGCHAIISNWHAGSTYLIQLRRSLNGVK